MAAGIFSLGRTDPIDKGDGTLAGIRESICSTLEAKCFLSSTPALG